MWKSSTKMRYLKGKSLNSMRILITNTFVHKELTLRLNSGAQWMANAMRLYFTKLNPAEYASTLRTTTVMKRRKV